MSRRLATLFRGLAVVAAVSLPGTLDAQSLLGTRGLGLPIEAMNARARALGSEGVGLMDGNLNATELATATGLLLPTANFSLQPHWGSGSVDGTSVEAQGTRFPLLGLAYPVLSLNGMVTLTYGAFMDQRWKAQETETIEVEGVPTTVTNTFTSDGGIAALRLGWSQRFGRTLSLSVNGGLHTGSVVRTYRRNFDELAGKFPELLAFSDGGKWVYHGLTAGLGAAWDPVDVLRLGASVTWSGDLDAKPTDDTAGRAATYALPTVFRFGATGVLTPALSLSLGTSYQNWTGSEGGLEPEVVAGGIWSFGGGLELEASGPWGRTLPLRIGMRRAGLPFLFNGEKATETLYSGGLGLNLTQADQFVLAGADLALERGGRTAGTLKEDFWRMTLTFRVSGW